MTTTLSFGAADSCEIALGEHTRLAPAANGRACAADPAAALRGALAAPLAYPPLSSAVVPGDRVTIALGKGVPQALQVVRGAVEGLVAAQIEPADITLLSTERFADASGMAEMLTAQGVRREVHDASDEAAIAMVGMTAAHRPLRLNRWLTDADFVLPIGVARLPGGESGPSKFGDLFPRFSNSETAERLSSRGKPASSHEKSQRAAESDEAGWLLGIGMSVVVVPGPGDVAAAIVAGEPGEATRAAARQFQAIWERPTNRQGDLVIAGVAGDASQQTWSNLARAVAACEKVVSEGGAIALCCELEDPPGGSFESLVDVVDFAAVARRLRTDAAADARPAMILAQALERGPVYLRSRLPADVVESLGMTPIESDAELSRLAAGRRHCVVIEEAQRVRPRFVS
jgi:hypothetical protein